MRRRRPSPFPGENFYEIGDAGGFHLNWAFPLFKARGGCGLLLGQSGHGPRAGRTCHSGLRPCRADPVARRPGPAASRRSARRWTARKRVWRPDAGRWKTPGPLPRKSRWCRIRSPMRSREHTDAVPDLDGRRAGWPCAVSVQRRCAGPDHRPGPAPCQGLCQFRRRIRPAAGRTDRGLRRVRVAMCRTATIRRRSTWWTPTRQ